MEESLLEISSKVQLEPFAVILCIECVERMSIMSIEKQLLVNLIDQKKLSVK